MISLDITNMYTNIPIKDTIQILNNLLISNKTLDNLQIKELLQLLQVILKQNYFSFNNQYFSQNDGLIMGCPLSSLLADIYINYFENQYCYE